MSKSPLCADHGMFCLFCSFGTEWVRRCFKLKIYELAKEVNPYVVEMRRYFHEHPELSNQEDKTIERIGQELAGMGIEYEVVPHGGIVAILEGKTPGKGKTVLLRADCDALPVQETKENLAGPRVCCSKVDGVMHACGHDGHTAMLLGAAKILKEHLDEVHGRIILFFERAEENGGGIPQMLAYMDEKGLKPDTVWGIHLYAGLESGKMGLLDGGTMASVFGFNVTIHGKGGHGSRPDQANSPIDCFVAIYNALEAARLTKITPFKPLTLSVGLLQAGAVSNVIPNDLTFAGTARLFDREEVGYPFKETLIKIVDGICAAYGCTATYNQLSDPAYPVYNDPECVEFARKVVGAELGEDVIAQPEPWMASESFSRLQKLMPGVFALVGVNNPEKGTGAAHHNEYFDIDEDTFKLAVTGAVSYALNFLESDIDTSARKWKGTMRDFFKDMGYTDEMIEAVYKKIEA